MITCSRLLHSDQKTMNTRISPHDSTKYSHTLFTVPMGLYGGNSTISTTSTPRQPSSSTSCDTSILSSLPSPSYSPSSDIIAAP
ncbi:hypothetical protein LINGRAHAP2_LOCUS32807 [Linum grandiflorum]